MQGFTRQSVAVNYDTGVTPVSSSACVIQATFGQQSLARHPPSRRPGKDARQQLIKGCLRLPAGAAATTSRKSSEPNANGLCNSAYPCSSAAFSPRESLLDRASAKYRARRGELSKRAFVNVFAAADLPPPGSIDAVCARLARTLCSSRAASLYIFFNFHRVKMFGCQN